MPPSGAVGLVELDCLSAFDCLLWLRTGERAGDALGCSQSTVSRATRRCQKVFDVKLVKRQAEWHVKGDSTLLHAERRVHQFHRWTAGTPLRLDAQHWLRHCYGDLPLRGWIKGNFNYLEYTRPRQLLQDRVIDAWLCSAPDHPQDDSLTVFPLCEMPTWLLVRHSHPLLKQSETVSLATARTFPILPLPHGAFPVFQAQLDQLGFHSDFSELKAIATAYGHDPHACEDLALAIASPLTLPLYGEGWSVLPLDLQLTKGDSLVVHRDMAEHPRTESLLRNLGQHLRTIAADHQDVRVVVGLTVH